MSDIILRAIKAKHGDSLLLFSGGAKVLIDGGPSGVYRKFLKPALEDLDNDNHLDLVMVSHIDADHIDGILGLTGELIESKQESRDPIVTIDEFWHNSFSDAFITADKTTSKAASAASIMSDLGLLLESPLESQLILSSVSQGRDLRLDIKALNIDLNLGFTDELVLQENQQETWKRNDLEIRVIGPTQAEVDDLKEKWAKELPKILEKEGATAMAAAKSLDTSISNLASIVVIANVGDKSILLTGDARGDMIVDWLEASGDLKAGGNIHFDIIKTPHHGSPRNVTPEFFKRVTADHYVVSGDGGHGNPGPKMFEMLFAARPNLEYQIHLTHSLEEIMSHRTYIKKGKNVLLDELFSDRKKASVLRFPDTSEGETFIDIVL